MALEPGPRRSMSPESSGRNSPAPRQWRNQLGAEDPPSKDKQYRKYASGVERALSLFDTNLQEWADYISFLSRLLKALQARQPSFNTVPSKALVAKRLAQCLNPSLPSGVHQKTLEVYAYLFSIIGTDGLSRDLPLYLPGLATTLSFASLTVRGPFLDLCESHLVHVNPKALRPAIKSIILALLPGLEDETSEDFDRTFKLTDSFKIAIRPPGSKEISAVHSSGDHFFWQCFFLAAITSPGRRPGALAYLVRSLPKLGQLLGPDAAAAKSKKNGHDEAVLDELSTMVTNPEPGLLLRCFAAGLADEQLLIQRGFLDLLVTHLPLHSQVLQKRVPSGDLELLLRAAAGVVTRRDMSLNRRLWAWFLGPAPASQEQDNVPESPQSPTEPNQHYSSSKTSYFEDYGLQPLINALLAMINSTAETNPTERARPYRICLSLMDRWEIGGLVVPEIFLPVIQSVKVFREKAASKSDFHEVLRSASVFFDGVESGLIYGEMVSLLAQAIGPGALSPPEREEKLALVQFIMKHFNIREEEMVTVHAPLAALATLAMLEDVKDRAEQASSSGSRPVDLTPEALTMALHLIELIPERAFPSKSGHKDSVASMEEPVIASTPNIELLKKIRDFYLSDQGNLEAAQSPFSARSTGALLVRKACNLTHDSFLNSEDALAISTRSRVLALLLVKAPQEYAMDTEKLLASMRERLSTSRLSFTLFKSLMSLSMQLHNGGRISTPCLSDLVEPLVRHAWGFLCLSEPKYHVETVKSLWQLQSVLSPDNRDIEASISALMLKSEANGSVAGRPAETGRSFSLLWSHSLQDTSSHNDRRPSKVTHGDSKMRLSGVEHYETMLTRPLFLMLDALLDERTQLFMAVKTWLNSMIGIEKLFQIFVVKFMQLRFLRSFPHTAGATGAAKSVAFDVDDDLELGLYYLRTFSNVLRWAPDAFWGVLATHMVGDGNETVREITGMEGEVSLQQFFAQVCMRCIAGNKFSQNQALQFRVAQLHRYSLNTLHQILRNPYSDALLALDLEEILIARLSESLKGPDPYIQVLLLDVTFATLKMRNTAPQSATGPPKGEKRALSHPAGAGRGPPIHIEEPASEVFTPPQSLLKCILAGLSSASSRPVLDSWVSFLTECLPLYSRTVFQVVIPLVETLCTQIGNTFKDLQRTFKENSMPYSVTNAPETTLISLLNALEQVLARAHDSLLHAEATASVAKSPDQPQGFFGNMVSGVFNSEAAQARSATANDRLTVHLAFQDAVRMCFKIWSWGQGSEAGTQDAESAASFNYTSLRMRNRARRLLEHLFAAEALECLETVVEIWRASQSDPDTSKQTAVLHLLPALDGSRPKHTIPAIFNSIYSRSNPGALDPVRKSTLTIELQDTDVVIFLVDYARSLEDDAMDEIWQDCMTFLKDLLGNPFPHRQTLPSLLEFAAILGEKVDNTNFGEQRKMRRELGDLFLRLLTALFTTRPFSFSDAATGSLADSGAHDEKHLPSTRSPTERADDVVGILSTVVPNLPKILVESDRVLNAASSISINLIGPSIRSKNFPETMSRNALRLLQELTRLPNNQKTWKKDIGDAFNDARFFSSPARLVRSDWLPLLKQWTIADKDRLTEILGRITPPTTAGIVFGVGATSARLEADRKTQLNLRRVATLILSSPTDTFVTDLPAILDKLVELLAATATSSPSSTTRAEIYMVIRALVLRTSAIHLGPVWPVVNAELHAAVSSVAAAEGSAAAELYSVASVLQACKLLDLLIAVAPDDFQLHQWLFVTDTVDAVYRSPAYAPVALADELSDELGNGPISDHAESSQSADREKRNKKKQSAAGASASAPAPASGAGSLPASSSRRRRLLLCSSSDYTDMSHGHHSGRGQGGGGDDDDEGAAAASSGGGGGAGVISDEDLAAADAAASGTAAAAGSDRGGGREELVSRVLRPFFGQLSIFAFESTYAMNLLDEEAAAASLLRDLFDERTIVKAL